MEDIAFWFCAIALGLGALNILLGFFIHDEDKKDNNENHDGKASE